MLGQVSFIACVNDDSFKSHANLNLKILEVA